MKKIIKTVARQAGRTVRYAIAKRDRTVRFTVIIVAVAACAWTLMNVHLSVL